MADTCLSRNCNKDPAVKHEPVLTGENCIQCKYSINPVSWRKKHDRVPAAVWKSGAIFSRMSISKWDELVERNSGDYECELSTSKEVFW